MINSRSVKPPSDLALVKRQEIDTFMERYILPHPGLQVDATGGAELIAHSYLQPGVYTAVEHTNPKEPGHDPAHMADLIVFVFGGKQESGTFPAVSEQPRTATVTGPPKAISGASIFRILTIPPPASVKTILPSLFQDGDFTVDKPVYGDFKGDGRELAAVALTCHPARTWARTLASPKFSKWRRETEGCG